MWQLAAGAPVSSPSDKGGILFLPLHSRMLIGGLVVKVIDRNLNQNLHSHAQPLGTPELPGGADRNHGDGVPT